MVRGLVQYPEGGLTGQVARKTGGSETPPLRTRGWGTGTPHQSRPRTAEYASPLGEAEERRPWRTVLDFGLAASPRQPPSSQPSPSRRHLRNPRVVARKTPHPSPLPQERD